MLELVPVPRMFGTVLIANRGEIAVRVIRACRDEGLVSVAVFSEADPDSPHVRLADAAVALPGGPRAAYLDSAALIDAARRAGADAIHPGYGFLSENADFAAAVLDAGLVWIGPPPQSIRLLGDKVSARAIAGRVGAPTAPGSETSLADVDDIRRFAKEHGFPLAIKAAHGGGGRGLRVVREEDQIEAAFASAVNESVAAFGRGECFVERYYERARHVEVQVLADAFDHVVAVGTRDCSLQRRHQKLVEEAPAPFLSSEQRTSLEDASRAICRAAGYRGAGTVEFLLAPDGSLAFLEVNTRLQVEHTVTEETTGLDLVREQFRIARGERLPYPERIEPRGHAIQFRINAEDPGHDFAPRPGRISALTLPNGPGVRVDSGVVAGSVISEHFDSMLAKLIVTGSDREQALARSRRALAELEIHGVPTVVAFHRAVVQHPDFTAPHGEFGVYTRWIETDWRPGVPDSPPTPAPGERQLRVVFIGGRPIRVSVPVGIVADDDATASINGAQPTTDSVLTPMQGTVVTVAVAEGEQVETGDLIAVVEAMKMENPVRAQRSGVVAELRVAVGDTVAQGTRICAIR
jgi:acetyl-CoA/propionyl-CoA carboxylase biotin carboxyl carrier protein